MLQCDELGDALKILNRILTDSYARWPHIPLPGRTLYLEVGMCVCALRRGGGLCVWASYLESGIYIHMCIFHVEYTYTHIIILSGGSATSSGKTV